MVEGKKGLTAPLCDLCVFALWWFIFFNVKERPIHHSYLKIQHSEWELDSKLFTVSLCKRQSVKVFWYCF